MSEASGISMRIIALDELMKVMSEVGRNTDDAHQKALLKSLFTAAKERHDFLKLSTREEDNNHGS
jgi:hypothetical protein